MAQDAFNGSAEPKSLTKQLDDIGGGIRSGFKSAMKELEVFIDQNRENRTLHLPVMQMIDSVRKKDPEAALRAAQTVFYHTRPQSDFEDMAVAKWNAIADDIAKSDIFKALNGEIMFAAVLANADRHFKEIAIAKWEELFSRALRKDPLKAADIAEHTLEFAYDVRRVDIFPPSTTEKIIHVAKESLTLAELRAIRTGLDRQEKKASETLDRLRDIWKKLDQQDEKMSQTIDELGGIRTKLDQPEKKKSHRNDNADTIHPPSGNPGPAPK